MRQVSSWLLQESWAPGAEIRNATVVCSTSGMQPHKSLLSLEGTLSAQPTRGATPLGQSGMAWGMQNVPLRSSWEPCLGPDTLGIGQWPQGSQLPPQKPTSLLSLRDTSQVQVPENTLLRTKRTKATWTKRTLEAVRETLSWCLMKGTM